MAAKRAERLVNLVIALLSTRQYVTAARIRATVPGYEADDGTDRADEAFKRMFERDKAELREMGVPLETGRTSAFDTEDGYRIARADYELPEIPLTGEEAAAVGLALRLWESAQLAGAAHSALVKLKAAGVDVDTARAIPLQPRLDAGEPAFEPCYAAARDRRALEFDYQRPDEDAPGPPARAAVGRRRLARPLVPRRPGPRPAGARGCSGSPAWSARRRPPARRAPSSRRPTSTSPRSSPARSGERSTWSSSAARPGTAVGLRRYAAPLGAADDGDDRLRAAHHRAAGGWPTRSPPTAPTSSSRRPTEVRDAVIARLTRLAAMADAA